MTTPRFEVPAPAEIAELRARVERDLTDVDAVTALVTAYAAEGELESARDLLQRAHERLPSEPTLMLMRGLVEQEMGLPSEAAERFTQYLDLRAGRLAAEASARLEMVRVPALRELAWRRLAERPPTSPGAVDPGLVVVFASTGVAANATLANGLEWMLEQSLARAGFEIVDRITSEVAIEATEMPTAGRPGVVRGIQAAIRLGAGQVVFSDLAESGSVIRWNLLVASIDSAGGVLLDSVSVGAERDSIRSVVARAGPAARRIMTDTLDADSLDFVPPFGAAALQAFGEGLRAAEAADWTASAAAFNEAATDPYLDQARAWGRLVAAILEVSARPLVASLKDAAQVGQRQRAVGALRTAAHSAHQSLLSRVGRGGRTEVSEVYGMDRIGGGLPVAVDGSSSAGGSP